MRRRTFWVDEVVVVRRVVRHRISDSSDAADSIRALPSHRET